MKLRGTSLMSSWRWGVQYWGTSGTADNAAAPTTDKPSWRHASYVPSIALYISVAYIIVANQVEHGDGATTMT